MPSGEFAIIQKYFAELGAASDVKGIALGIGDDAAVLNVTPGKQLVVAADTLIAGIHFPETADGGAIACRALRVNLSDMAAMGASPRWFTLALTMPDANATWLESFSQGLAQDAVEFGCALVGGDTTKGPLAVSIQMLGEVETGAGLTRSGAKPGDVIYITGTLGAAAAALDYLDSAEITNTEQALLTRYYLPTPRVAEGALLQGVASAAIDISDGLLADLGHIANCSQVGARLYIDKLPVFPELVGLVDQRQALIWALTGGDDYELCFTVAPTKQPQLLQLLEKGAIEAMAVGEITEGVGVECVDQEGQTVTFEDFNRQPGYQHF